MPWPMSGVFQPATIWTPSQESLGPLGSLGSPASAVWPAANLAIYVPFRIAWPLTVAQLAWTNGAAVSGNVDCAIYSADGTKLCSTGSTAQAGTNVIQAVDITDIQIGPGLFYLALQLDNGTGTTIAYPLSASRSQAAGMAQQAVGAFPLPAAATFASVANAYIPVVGFTTKAVY